MNLSNLIGWCPSIVLAFVAIGKIDTLQMWIWKAQARVIYESRTANWGSPRFFPSTGHSSAQSKSMKSHYAHLNINRRAVFSAANNKGGVLTKPNSESKAAK